MVKVTSLIIVVCESVLMLHSGVIHSATRLADNSVVLV